VGVIVGAIVDVTVQSAAIAVDAMAVRVAMASGDGPQPATNKVN
jgi:hypothetical protein